MDEFFILLVAVVVAFVIGGVCYATGTDNPSGYAKNTVICEYEGGELKDDVCIKGDRVITIDLD